MADYNVTARFEADASAYIQAVNHAKQATEGLGDSADKAGKQAGKAFDGADKSVDKTGKAAEAASKQTDGLGDSASKAGQETQSAFDGAEAGIEATGASAEAAGASVEGVGQSAAQATQELQQAFDSAQAAVDSSAAAVENAKQREVSAIQQVRDAEQQLNAARASGDQEAVIAASANLAKAKDEAAAATKDLASAEKELASASQQAASAQADLGAATTKSSSGMQQLGDGMRQVGSFVRDNQRDIQTMGAAITTVGAGWAAFNTTMAATGIAYNTLQQVSAKSMETMMGSIEGANLQMERFHAFADESPFSRATFLQAQQTLMAFGMEAERVVPSLEGIQNAVAAIGGGDAEILRLVDILGAVEGQGKITGRELNRMGQMGINAADIIGEQMGKSGAAIREEITAGTLDADAALEALTTGMSERFDGAAAGLKETFEGAIDRVKAAFRDLSGESFEWAVGSDGGGLFVDLLNQVADFMRVVQQLPGPVKNALGVIGTLGSTATVAAGGFLLLAPQAVQAWDAFVKLSNATGATTLLENIQRRAPQAGAGLRAVGNYAGAAAVAFTAFYAASAVAGSGLDDMAEAETIGRKLRVMAGDTDATRAALTGFATATGSGGASINSMSQALETVNYGGFLKFLDSAGSLFGVFDSDAKLAEEAIGRLDTALAQLAIEGDFDALATGLEALKLEAKEAGVPVEDLASNHLPMLMAALEDIALDLDLDLADDISEVELLEWALTGVPPAAVEAADGLDDMGGAAESLNNSLEGVIGKLQQMGLLALSERDALRGFEESLLDANEAVDEYGKVLDKNGNLQTKFMEEGIKAQDELDGIAESTRGLMEAQIENGASQEELTATYERGKKAYIDTAVAMGMGKTEAKALADSLFAIPDKHGTTIDIETYGLEVAEALAREIEELPEHKFVDVAVHEDGSFTSIQESVNELGEPILVSVDAEGNATEVTRSIREIDGERVIVLVDDDGTVMQLREDIEGEVATLPVDAEVPDPQEIIEQMIGDGRAVLGIDADTAQAEEDVQSLADMDVTGSVVIVVDDNGTQAEVQQRINSTTGKTETVVVTDDGTVARVQQQIIDVNGVERTVWVDDNGTVYDTQGLINNVSDGSSTVHVTENGAAGVQNTIDNIRGKTVTVTVTQRIHQIQTSGPSQNRPSYGLQRPGGYMGGVVGRDFGLAAGGVAGTPATGGIRVPRLANGGRLPYTGLGQDMILGRNRQGVPTAWVDDGEWVINQDSSRRYHDLLGLVNRNHPSVRHLATHADGGQAGRARLASSVGVGSMAPNVTVSGPQIDYARLADTVLEAAQSMPIDNRLQIDNRTFARLVTNANKQSESLGAR